MAGNSFGGIFRITTFGECRDAAIGVVIDGCPAELEIDLDFLQLRFDHRRPGQSTITTQRKKSDFFKMLSGVYEGENIGSPMIRLILGHTYQTGTGVKTVSTNPIKVYPNPTMGMLSFDLPESGDTYSIQLYSLLGQLSLSRSMTSSNSILDISNLTEGIYMLRVTDDKTGITYQNKIVKSAKE